MRLIKAKFRGQNGSLGYEYGKEYILFFKENQGFLFFPPKYQIEIWRASHEKFSSGYCPYSSVTKFIENWEVVKFL